MDLTDFRLLGVVGIIVVGLVTTAGVVVVGLLATWVVETGLAVAGWLGPLRGRAAAAGGHAARSAGTRAADGSPGLDPGTERLRC